MKININGQTDTAIILYEPYFEPYHLLMGELPFQFVLFDHAHAKKWDYRFGPPPENHTIVKTVTPDLYPDLMIVQHRARQTMFYRELQKTYKCNLINIEYSLPNKNEAEELYGLDTASVYFSENQAAAWWAEKGAIIKPAAKIPNSPNYKISVNDSVDYLSFFNVLNCMAAGNCVVSTPVYEIGNLLIKNFSNGFLFPPNDTRSAQNIIDRLKNDPDLIKETGLRARETVINEFNIENFKLSWVKLINEYIK